MNLSPDPLQPHAHDPNPVPPSGSPAIVLSARGGWEKTLSVTELKELPAISVPGCYIVSTGHGTSGPFTFHGVSLATLLSNLLPASVAWTQVEVISADGFGTRIYARELKENVATSPIILSYAIDGRPLTREEGLVRLIVPSETDDALRQVKWISQISVL